MNPIKQLPCGQQIPYSETDQCKNRIIDAVTALCKDKDNYIPSALEICYALFDSKGMNQSDLAKAKGVSRQAISKILKHSKVAIHLKEKRKKAYLLKCEMAYNMYVQGETIVNIASALGLNYETEVLHLAKRYAREKGLLVQWRQPGWQKKKTVSA